MSLVSEERHYITAVGKAISATEKLEEKIFMKKESKIQKNSKMLCQNVI